MEVAAGEQLDELTSPEYLEEVKASLLKAGAPFDDTTARMVHLRSTIAGSISFGISLGIALAGLPKSNGQPSP
jgi:hypothetical protein